MNIKRAIEIVLKAGYEIKWCDRLIIGIYSQSAFTAATNEIEFEKQLQKIVIKISEKLFDERIKNCEEIEKLQAENEEIDKKTEYIKGVFGDEE